MVQTCAATEYRFVSRAAPRSDVQTSLELLYSGVASEICEGLLVRWE